MRVPVLLLAAALLRPCASAVAAEPAVSFDDRADLDGFFELSQSSAPEGFFRPPEAFAAVAPPADAAAAPARSVAFDSRAQVLLRLGPAPELRDAGVPETVAARVGTPAEVARWLTALRALARSPQGADALSALRRELAPQLESFRARLSSGAFAATIEEYTGLPLPGPHHLVLSPFHAASGVANVVAEREDGGVEVTSLFGPERSGGAPEFWTVRVPGTLWHEESHGILDPLADAWAARIARARPADPAAVCYGEWRQCVREHVVRAVMLRLMERRLGAAAAAEQLRFEDPSRFRWLEKMTERLKDYEADRRRWPTLADFYPRLLDVIREEGADSGDPLDPAKEPAPVRARIARLAQTAAPKMRDAAARAHLSRAGELCARKLDLARASAAPAASSRGARLKERGMSAFAAGRREEALGLFAAALDLDPGDAEAEMSRATILEDLGRADEATAAFGRASDSARRRPEDFPPHVLADALGSYGRLLARAGRAAEARAALSEALSSAPEGWSGRAEAERLLSGVR